MITTLLIALLNLSAGAKSNDPAAPIKPTHYAGLEHVFLVFDGLINGSAPHGDAGFDSLRQLNIKTIICVDGAAPDVEAARSRGMRYVHLPIGYEGITEEKRRELARAVHELPKPIYIHCFHGKHRSPAAGAYVAVALGKRTNAAAIELMKNAGTAPHYRGLYDAVEKARPLRDDELAAAGDAFPEVARVSNMVTAMARLGRHGDHLKRIRDAGWKTPEEHPDLDPAHEASAVEQLLRDLQNMPEASEKPFAAKLTDAMRAAEALRGALNRDDTNGVTARFDALIASCKACHQRFRD